MNEVTALQKNITDQVSKRVKELESNGLALPPKYNAQNALKSAFFAISKVKNKDKEPAIKACSKESIANCLLDMVTQGLSPAKTQCYFIAYGNELQMQRSYFGTVAVLKRLKEVKDIYAEVIHQDDIFEIDSDDLGRIIVKSFIPKFENMDKPLVGAFAVVQKLSDEKVYTIMTKKEIDKSWSKTKAYKNTVQQDFSQEMAKRTVINRAAKMFVNTSDDSDLMVDAISRTTSNEYEDDERKDVTPKVEKTKKLAERFSKPEKKEPAQLAMEKAKQSEKAPEQPKNVIIEHEDEEMERHEPEQHSIFEAVNAK
ncbi:MAG: recombinase RecT [Liquorilactobacillus nagelii]|jgi:recombination protein RecT|uniref:recombinase RecT n=1 Tax=Liquorilactobacillus nagelii TaxID=82688 RepID=UPI00242B9680|nr:RecT family recombinase [Liquorilactobacillus nagelii]MCI1632970.1 recombinase RecT [Liquorilactobacillus nagelii]